MSDDLSPACEDRPVTFEELRTLAADKMRWPTGLVAATLFAGREPDTLRNWLAGQGLPRGAADYLARVESVADDGDAVVIRVRKPPRGTPGRPRRAAPPPDPAGSPARQTGDGARQRLRTLLPEREDAGRAQ